MVLRAFGADGALLAERKRLRLNESGAVLADLQVSREASRSFRPVVAQLGEWQGSPLDLTVLAVIDRAIALIRPDDEDRQALSRAAARQALPAIAHAETLGADAWSTLRGDPNGAERFRAALEALGPRQVWPGRRSSPFGLPLAVGATKQRIKLPRSKSQCALPRERFVLLSAAALSLANSLDEAIDSLVLLEDALTGLKEFERLVAEASAAILGDRSSFRTTLSHLEDAYAVSERRGLKPYPEPKTPALPLLDLCWNARRQCLAELFPGLVKPWEPQPVSPFAPPKPTYVVASLTPTNACPGTTVTLTGSGFGPVPGKVCFPDRDYGAICVDPTYWSETEIHATVPSNSGSGIVSLEILDGTTISCNDAVPIYRSGTGVAFAGGVGYISALSASGDIVGGCVRPGGKIDVNWTASPAGNVSVRVRVEHGSQVLLDQSGLAAASSVSFTAPSVTSPDHLAITVTASNACGSGSRAMTLEVSVPPTIAIAGVEITQGIQTFWRTGVADNSLATIANKDTIVRLYVSADRGGFNNDQVPGVWATLDVDGVTLTPINGITPTNPGGGTPYLTVGNRAGINRSRTDDSFNFRIPAGLSQGAKQLFARVVAPAGAGRSVVETRLVNWSWTEETPLRVRWVSVTDNRPQPTGTGTAPDDAQARHTILRAFDLLPSPPTDIVRAWASPRITDRPFETDAGLQDLLNDIDGLHDTWEWIWALLGEAPAQEDAHWLALTAPLNRGWSPIPGNTSVAAMYEDSMGRGAIQRVTPAHELAHSLGFQHVNQTCGNTINGPFYNHPNSGVLEDVPFDPYWNEALSGAVDDFMSYGCTVWSSADSWNRLQSAI
jgi:hypothetical protein